MMGDVSMKNKEDNSSVARRLLEKQEESLNAAREYYFRDPRFKGAFNRRTFDFYKNERGLKCLENTQRNKNAKRHI
jgi:hypothetical protein